MQKIINVLALASTAVSVAVVGSGLYVYINRASIIDGVKSQVMEAVTGSLGGLGGVGGGSALPIGSPTSPVRAPPPRADPPMPPITCDLMPSMMESLLTYTYTPLAAMAPDKAKDATASTFIIFCILLQQVSYLVSKEL